MANPVSPDTVPTVQNFDVDDLIDISTGGGGGNNTIRIQDTAEIVSRREIVHVDMADTYEIPVTDGYIRYGHYESTGPAYTTQEIQRVTQDIGDSNTSIIKRSTIKQPYNTSVDSTTGKMTVSGNPKSGGLATNAAYFINAVNAAAFCVSAGVALGKGFSDYLYTSNPDYWDSIGLATLNPETWASITAEDDSLNARIFNAIFGIDSATGNAQMYMDSEAFAYIAQCLANAGIFNSGEYVVTDSNYPSGYSYSTWIQPISFAQGCSLSVISESSTVIETLTFTGDAEYSTWVTYSQSNYLDGGGDAIFISRNPMSISSDVLQYIKATGVTRHTTTSITNYGANTVDGVTIYICVCTWAGGLGIVYQSNPTVNYVKNGNNYITLAKDFYRFMTRGTISGGTSVEGVTDQQGATLPNTSNWTDQASTDASLRQQYPDLYANAIKYDVPDANGNLIEKTYVPVAWPNTTANPWTDTQPTTDTALQTQTSTMVNLLQGGQTQVDTLTKTITQPVNTTPTGTVPPSENPTDTGSGSSPVPVTPTGSASALWSVYHPSQTEINSFGAWLWSTNFIDQLLKMFQNPMEGVISLHKVFATPVDAGTGTIVVGTLNSGVSSAIVSQQYVEVSCGSVDCHEDFGNVFDYSPHTTVSLYLPFIGIVPLNVDDVMRSTITVKYGVDVFTGACLAMVEVKRDNAAVNMYQYSGVCSVEYPLSNVQNSQLMSGLMAVAAGGAAISTGGMSVAAGAAVAGGLISSQKHSIGRSGGFSGNSGAMGIKKPYLIITRPQTKVAELFPRLNGYPTNKSGQLSDFSGHVKVSNVHVEGIPATDRELSTIENILHEGILI